MSGLQNLSRDTKIDNNKNNTVLLTLMIYECVPVTRLGYSRAGTESFTYRSPAQGIGI